MFAWRFKNLQPVIVSLNDGSRVMGRYVYDEGRKLCIKLSNRELIYVSPSKVEPA